MSKHEETPQDSSTGIQDMIRLLGRRDGEALEHWFSENAKALYTFVYYSVGKDRETAADVVQETFLDALNRIDEYDPVRGHMSVWLAWLARNHIRVALRERKRFQTANDFWERIDAKLLRAYHNLDSELLPEETIERRETADLVRMAFAQIHSRYQQVLKGYYWESRSIEELARSEGTTVGAVKSVLHRARQAFQTAFGAIADVCNDLRSAREDT